MHKRSVWFLWVVWGWIQFHRALMEKVSQEVTLKRQPPQIVGILVNVYTPQYEEVSLFCIWSLTHNSAFPMRGAANPELCVKFRGHYHSVPFYSRAGDLKPFHYLQFPHRRYIAQIQSWNCSVPLLWHCMNWPLRCVLSVSLPGPGLQPHRAKRPSYNQEMRTPQLGRSTAKCHPNEA